MKSKNTPRHALIVRVLSEKNYADVITLQTCEVLKVSDDGFSTVRVRVGSEFEIRYVNTSDLASTPDRALAKLSPHLSALLSRAPLSTVAVMTDDSAATLNQTAK